MIPNKKIKSQSNEIELLFNNSSKYTKEIDDSKTNSNILLNNIKEILENVVEKNEQVEKFSQKLQELKNKNEKYDQDASKLIEESEKIKKKIETLLPGATSAGLAEAFSKKVTSLSYSKYCWLLVFVASLIWLSQVIVSAYPSPSQVMVEDVAREFFHRLPFILAPVWLAWFSARSYGHIVRLQEKYSYKEVISRAFEGYKKQMEDMDTETLSAKLAFLSMEILAENPSEVFERGCVDETPLHSLIKMFKGLWRKSENKES